MEDKKYSLEEIIDKFIGPVTPVADATIDEQRSKNLDELTDLISVLCFKLFSVSNSGLTMYSSSNEIIQKAKEAEKNLREIIGENDEE